PPALQGPGRELRRMSLEQAIEVSLRSNLALALQKERVVEVATGRTLANAAFEPLVLASAGRTLSKSPPATAQEGQAGQVLKTTQDAWSVSLLEHLPTGTDFRFDWTNGRTASGFQNAVAPELFRSGLSLSLVQPLLRDFSFDLHIQRAP